MRVLWECRVDCGTQPAVAVGRLRSVVRPWDHSSGEGREAGLSHLDLCLAAFTVALQ